jgi:acyl-coenzyme A thioesterase PaaI-like protein
MTAASSSDFQPADADFAARVRGSFAQQAAMALIGAELVEVGPGRIVMTLAHSARGPLLRVEGRVTKAGRTISVADGQAWQPHPTRPGEDQLVATITATLMTITGRDDVRH